MLAKFSYFFLFLLCLAGFSSHLGAAQKSKIKAVVFDFGGVIAQSDHNEIDQFIATSLNLSPAEVADAKERLKKLPAQEREEEEAFWISYLNSKGKQLPNNWMEQLDEARFRAIKVIPGMVDLVKNLQQQGFRTALLSNVRKNRAQIKSKLGYYDLFHPVLFSYEIGVSKPDPQAYRILLDQLKLPPHEVLFIDNKLANVEAAKSAGMDAIHFINTQQLIEELKKRGIEVSASN
jgi:putative hydrolase of the HAD superfamily